MLLLLGTVSPLRSQEPSAAPSETAQRGDESADILRRSLALDIESASAAELEAWCERLDLSTAGGAAELRDRLTNHYQELFPGFDPSPAGAGPARTPPAREGSADGGSERLELEHADRLESSGAEERSVRLTGGVVLRMRGGRQEALHTIMADTLHYNAEGGILTAAGSVRYVMEQGGELQEFTGDALSFDVEDFHGIFLGGITQQEQQFEDRRVTFYFRGRSIYRGPGRRVFFRGGMISSSPAEEPYYSITTDKLWLLGPDEWAISGGVLRLGRVPLLYIPFFFQPGDELIFRPSFQYAAQEGYIIRTTTYLLGRPRQQSSGGFSFLQLEEQGGAYEYERRGLFLHKTGQPREESWVSRSGSYSKLILDYYTHLGLFLGTDTAIYDTPPLSELELLAGLGLTRYFFPLPGYSGAYTPYRWDAGSSAFVTDTQKPYILGTQIPFRFGFDIAFAFDWQELGLSLKAPFYSDPYFRSRLTDREEGLDFEQFTAADFDGLASDELFRDPVFELHLDYRPTLPAALRPLISTFSVDRLESRLRLSQEETLPSEEGSGTESPIGYYYPEVLTPAEVAFTVGGTLFSYQAGEGGTEEQAGRDEKTPQDTPPEDLRPPSELSPEEREGGASEEEEPEGDAGLRLPDYREADEREETRQAEPFSHRLGYSLTSDAEYHTVYGKNATADPADIGFDPSYSFASTAGSSDWSYRADIFDERLQFEHVLGVGGEVRRHFQEDPGVDISDYLEQDRKASYLDVEDELRIRGSLFPNNPEWNASRLEYRVYSDLYQLSYNTTAGAYLPRFWRWDEESIGTHEAEIAFRYASGDRRLLLSNRTVLPPLAMSSLFRLQLRTRAADAFLSLNLQEKSGGIPEVGPLEVEASLRFWEASRFTQELLLLERQTYQRAESELELSFFDEELRFLQSFEWNIDAGAPQRSYTALDLWWLSFGFDARDTATYELVYTPTAQWSETGGEAFVPYQFTAGADYSYEPDPLWRQRIRLSAFVDSSLRADLQRFTDSSLVFGAGFRASIAEFLEFNFRVSSENTAVYRYIPAWADRLGLSAINPAEDLIKSFNFFNTQDRLNSNFNLNSLSLDLVHHMPDWDLIFDYYGAYEVNESKKKYEWTSRFTISLQWNPIPIMKREVSYDDNELQY
jgi:lipopolysaccharide assembly outer membrane protein LptD (OstA)